MLVSSPRGSSEPVGLVWNKGTVGEGRGSDGLTVDGGCKKQCEMWEIGEELSNKRKGSGGITQGNVIDILWIGLIRLQLLEAMVKEGIAQYWGKRK